MQNQTRDYHTQRPYRVDGNTVRRVEAEPDYRRQQRERQEKEERENLRRRRRAAARNREKELRMSKSYVVFLTMAVTVFGIFCGTYVKMQSDMTSRMKKIAVLESQIADLKADNDEAYKRINTAADLENIRNTAINDLGMFYATEDQIVYYTVDKSDYMNQYGEIPEK